MTNNLAHSGLAHNSEYESLVTKRAAIKRKITISFKQVPKADSAYSFENLIVSIKELLSEVRDIDNQVNVIIGYYCEGDSFPGDSEAELQKQTEYLLDVNSQLATLSGGSASHSTNRSDPIINSQCNVKLLDLRCKSFTGEGSNELQIHAFITQFNNVIGCRSNLSNSTKLTYLKTYLKGYALKIVQHLKIYDANYAIALVLLDKEFLDKIPLSTIFLLICIT